MRTYLYTLAEMLLMCTLQDSGEVDASGRPRGFLQPVLSGLHSLKHYPTLFSTQMSAARARDALTYLQVSRNCMFCSSNSLVAWLSSSQVLTHDYFLCA